MDKKIFITRSLWIAGGILAVVGAFYGGLWTAFHMSWKLQSNPILTNIVLEAVLTQANIEHLDDGLPEKARESLMLILDGQILKIATLMETTAAEKDREIGKQFLHRVAKHRNKYPATYPDWAEATGVTKTKGLVTEILKSVKTEDH